jgi:hypothetical protein
MYTKAIDLKEFYDSLQGRVVQRVLRQHLRSFWPSVAGMRMLGVGFAVPHLKPFLGEAERIIALMPSHQGAVFWPMPEKGDEKGLVSICNEAELPIETNSIDRMLVVHGLQGYESLDAILRESWRVLTGQGRLILVVPNRTGIWARVDSTPFGHGTPYSVGQVRHFLKEYLFVPERAERALFVPPSTSRLLLSTATAWEKIGQKFFNAFGGVNIVEASKQLYAGTMVGATTTSALIAARRRVAPAGPMSRVIPKGPRRHPN